MKLVYLAQIGLFDDWAHTVQIMKMCEAFAENKVEVELIVPKRAGYSSDPFLYHNTTKIFKIRELPFVDMFPGSPSAVWYWIRFVSFLISARVYLVFSSYDVLYTRELYVAPFFRNVFIERHSFSNKVGAIQSFIFRVSKGIVVLTSFIKSRMIEVGINPEKIIVVSDSVKLEDFKNLKSKQEIRTELGIKKDIYLFGYAGTLKTMGMEKGVSTAIESLVYLPDSFFFYVIGGEDDDILFYKKFALDQGVLNRIMFVGKVKHENIPIHISACDALIAPFPENEHYSFFMSPLKIFEYMASQRPIIATSLPSLREVLTDGEDSLLIPPSDPKSLAKALVKLKENPEFGNIISARALATVAEKYTWNKRAKTILDFIKK